MIFCSWPADETQFALELAENEDDGGNLMIIECLQRQDDQVRRYFHLDYFFYR